MPRILIADDHDLVRDTLVAFLSHIDEFTVLPASDMAQSEVELGRGEVIDIALLDYDMPGMKGLEGLRRALAHYPSTKFALMSGAATPEIANQAIALGAQGFFPKSAGANSLVNAIRFMLAGERYLPVDYQLSDTPAQKRAAFMGLSRREMEVLGHLCEGLANKEIARQLDLREVTVKLHVKNILAKLEVTNRTQAALLAKKSGVF